MTPSWTDSRTRFHWPGPIAGRAPGIGRKARSGGREIRWSGLGSLRRSRRASRPVAVLNSAGQVTPTPSSSASSRARCAWRLTIWAAKRPFLGADFGPGQFDQQVAFTDRAGLPDVDRRDHAAIAMLDRLPLAGDDQLAVRISRCVHRRERGPAQEQDEEQPSDDQLRSRMSRRESSIGVAPLPDRRRRSTRLAIACPEDSRS